MGRLVFRVTAVVAFFVVSIGMARAPAFAQDTAPTRSLERFIAGAADGGTVVLQPGTYIAEDLRILKDLTLIGEGEVIITATQPVAKGLLVPGPNTTITVQNLTFVGAESPDLNGAGIRFEGYSLTVDQCTFRDNENGILATGSPDGILKVSRSKFIRNGHGDGYSHAIYQSSGRRFEIETSVFAGTRVGHHLKTLASEVSVTQNTFDDHHGETSYVVDLSAGGLMFVDDNLIIRRQSASQRTLFNYDSTRGGRAAQVFITNNRIISEKRGFRLIRNPENAPVTDSNNTYPNASAAPPMPVDPGPRRSQFTAAQLPAEIPAAPAQTTVDPDLSGLTPAQARAVRRLMKNGAQTVTAPQSAGLRSSGTGTSDLLYGPAFEALPPAGVAAFKIRELGDGSRYLTFGQPFEKGAVPAGSSIVAKVGERTLATQVDAKATHTDGSLRHAVVTVLVPEQITSSNSLLLVRAPETPHVSGTWPNIAPASWTLQVAGDLGAGDQTYQLSVAEVFSSPAAVWLDGPLVREETASVGFGPLLTAQLDLRRYADGTGRLRVTLENHKTFSEVPRDIRYAVRLIEGANDIADEFVPLHYRNSGWTFTVPINGVPALDVIHDPRVLIASGALPTLDLSVPVNRNALPELEETVRLGDHEPLTPYFLSTGGRGEIGPVSLWGAAWAVTQSDVAKQAMLRVANLGLTIPWHYAEDSTGLPVRIDQRWNFWADSRGTNAQYREDRLAEILHAGETGGWSVDLAHKPSLAYPAYLATGDLAYLRGLRHEAAYAVSAVIPEVRKGGALVTGAIQLRGAAWSLRTISNAAFILPDDDPFKAYMVQTRDANFRNLRSDYLHKRIMAKAGETEGYLNWDNGRNRRAIATWQNDFFAMVVANEARRGTPFAAEVTNWLTNFTAGRVIAARGDLRRAAAFDMIVKSDSGIHHTTWDDLFAATLALGNDAPYTGGAEGEFGVLRAALGAIYAATQDQRAAVALEMLRAAPEADKLYDPNNQLGRMWNPQFNLDPREGL